MQICASLNYRKKMNAEPSRLSPLKQWFSTWGRDPRGVVNHFGRDRVVILYVHSCITFALFEF